MTPLPLTVLLLFASSLVGAADKAPPVVEGTRTAQKEISAILSSIPTAPSLPDRNLSDRLLRLNIDVQMVSVGRFTADDVKANAGELRTGDVDYQFFTTQPNERVLKECTIFTVFSFTRRGHLWIPSSRAANYFMNGLPGCRLP